LLDVALEDPRPWKAAMDAVFSFLPEGVLRFSSDGVYLRSIDPSQVVLVDLFAPKSLFSKYSVEGSIPVPLDFSEYTKILSRVGAEDRLRMRLEDVNLAILVERAGGEFRREFYLPLIDVQEREADIPTVPNANTVSIRARLLKDALRDSGIFATSAVFVARPDLFMIEAKSQQGVTRMVARPGDDVKITGESESISRYSLPFVQNIVKAADADSFITISFGSDTPVRIEYSVSGIKLKFFLAHMVI
jgi:proliferating cell nuclear antigen